MNRAGGHSTQHFGGAVLRLTILICLLGTLSSSYHHGGVGQISAGATGMSDNLQYQDVADAPKLKEDMSQEALLQTYHEDQGKIQMLIDVLWHQEMLIADCIKSNVQNNGNTADHKDGGMSKGIKENVFKRNTHITNNSTGPSKHLNYNLSPKLWAMYHFLAPEDPLNVVPRAARTNQQEPESMMNDKEIFPGGARWFQRKHHYRT